LEGPRASQHREPASASSPALQKLTAIAEDLRKAEPELSAAAAFTKVYTNPVHRELAAAERRERRQFAVAG